MIHRKLLKICQQQINLHGPKRYLSANPASGLYQVLSTDPPIFYVKHWMSVDLKFMECLDMLFEHLRDRRAYFLYSWAWNIESAARAKIARHFEKRHHRRYPLHQFIHLCNTPLQRDVFLESGLQAVLCSQLCLVDERVFRPISDLERTIDAVYSARFQPYKRHQLASMVESLGVVYPFQEGVDKPEFVEEIRNLLSHAHFFNHPDGTQYRRLTPEEVNASLNKCRVGLCLSAVEGAMYGSIEYLLAGLPIVSTQSKGGRHLFFDNAYVRIVDERPEAVREGVEELISREISPELVRQKTLEKIHEHRQIFISLVQDIYKSEGVTRDFAQEWPEIFANKLYVRRQHKETIALLDVSAQTASRN